MNMPLDRALGTPDAEAIIAPLVSQNPVDLLARRATELPFHAVFTTRQLIGTPQKAQRRANFVQDLYENSAVSAEFGAKPHGTFCKIPHKTL